jgi:hypothetical protein
MKFARLWFVAATASAVGSLAVVWHLRQPEQLVGPLRQELATLPDNEVETPLRRFAELGDPGLKALAESLASERAAVRQGARRVLLEEVDRWTLLSDDAVAPRLESLARGLAEAAPRMDTENRRLAADFALRLVLWPREADSRPGAWLADCESVLAAVAVRRPPTDRAADLLADKNATAAEASRPVPGSPGLSDVSLTLADKVRLPGGALPLDESPMPDVGGFVEPRIAQDTASPESHEPRRLQVPANTRSLGGDGDGEQPGAANRPGRLPSASGNARQTALGLQARKQSLGGPTANDTAAWRKLEPRDVMSRLHVSDPQVVLAAREELERRGISGPLVDLARRATDPDPKVRRQLAESLPRLPGVDAKPWLLELSHDENAEVRTTAVTLMATSGDLEMIRRLEQISRDDPDDYTRAQAAKTLALRQR